MIPRCLRKSLRTLILVAGLPAILLMSGCIGIYNNSSVFELKPTENTTTEAELLQRYGGPSFMTEIGKERIYVYKVRDNMYIILVGIFNGYDLVIHCEDGVVTKMDRVERPKAFSLFQPWTWADTE